MQIETQEYPKLIVLIGLPGSGKSTWRDKFVDKTDIEFEIISSDDEIERLCAEAGINYTEGYKRFIGRSTKIVKQKFREAVNNGNNVIWDQTNLTAKKRRGILQKLPDGYRREAVSFEVTLEELTTRLTKREAETGKHVPDFVVKTMAQSYVPPTKGEGFDKVTIVK
jgi:predicted kinase